MSINRVEAKIRESFITLPNLFSTIAAPNYAQSARGEKYGKRQGSDENIVAARREAPPERGFPLFHSAEFRRPHPVLIFAPLLAREWFDRLTIVLWITLMLALKNRA